MNLASILVLSIILLGVWYAIRTLRKNDGHPCSSCRGGDGCAMCEEMKKRQKYL